MAQIETWLPCDLRQTVEVVPLKGHLYSGDVNGNKIGVEIIENGVPHPVSGTLVLYGLRHDGVTVVTRANISNTYRPSVSLAHDFYDVVGPIQLVLRLLENGQETTLAACTTYVYKTTSEQLIDSGGVVPDLTTLIARVDDCQRAADAANAAAASAQSQVDAAQQAASNAQTAAQSAQTQASNAATAAAAAQTAAQGAQTQASNAATAASNAQTAAQNAQTQASNAATAASNAQTAAETSQTQATNAATAASTAQTAAQTAQGQVSTAQAAASRAQSEAENAAAAARNAQSQAGNAAASAGEAADAANSANRTANAVSAAFSEALPGLVQDAEVRNNALYLLNGEGEIVAGPFSGFGGGGGSGSGGSGGPSTVTLTNVSGYAAITITDESSLAIQFSWSSIEDSEPTGNGTLRVYVNGTLKETRDIAQGTFAVQPKAYLSRGDNTVKVTVTDTYGVMKQRTVTVTMLSLYIVSSFENNQAYTDYIEIPYVPYGDISKTIHFVIDGVDTDRKTTSASGRQLTYIMQYPGYGAHTLEIYFVSEVNGQEVESNHLYFEIIFIDNNSTTPVITSSFSRSNVNQYETLAIPWMIYTPNSMYSNVSIYVNGALVSELTGVDRSLQTFSYRADSAQTTTIRIVSGISHKEITFSVTAAEIEVEAETNNLALYLSSAGRNNNEEHPDVWAYTDGVSIISAQFNNFNFDTNGWLVDNDGVSVLRINGGATLTIPYQIFAQDFRTTGKTIELEFTVKDVLDYDAVWFSCFSGNRGIKLTPQYAMLKSEQAEIDMQFKEDDHIRIAFVVEKRANNRLIVVYIDSIPSGVIQYDANDNFQQATPVGITIGNANCSVDLYCIRVYNNDLTRKQILDNWIADTQDGNTMLSRYSRNNIYDAYGNIVISKLPNNLPYMIIECPELPQYKGDKKTCTGSFVNPLAPDKSFTFTGCQINVQGTSSAPYYRKNYDMQFKNGFVINGNNVANYEMDPSVLPFNRFVVKADVASSEGANNVELVKLYCELDPYKRREMIADPKVRQGIYGFPIVIFWTNTDTNETSFLGKYNFNFPKRAPGPYGYSGNMESWEFQNNTSNLMLFRSDYFDETMRVDLATNEEKETWRYDYEARFPSDEWVDYSKLQEFQSFVYSTMRENATGNALAESETYDGVTYTTDTAAYRLAKFKAHFGDYAEVNSFIFYYLFTEFFLMVDSRAKNLFIGFSGSDADPEVCEHIDRKVVAEPYDMDTALGTNNEGTLEFGYSLEDTDHKTGGADIFNGQTSTLWNNLRDAFSAEIARMYQTLRSGGKFNYSFIENRFEAHQAIWPEAIWVEDSWFKYIVPLVTPDPGKDPTDAYLDMMQGSKREQRRWWLNNRFKYMDSKWNSGEALSEVIQFRAYDTASLTVTPYADLYVTVKYGSYTGQARASQGTPVTIAVPIDSLSDTETYIYSASQIADIGDLSPFKIGWIDFSKATRIRRIKIGDSDANYRNYNFTRFSLGNNRLVTLIDVRNCIGLGTGDQKSIDISGCVNVEEVYFDGTSITGVTLPSGGVLRKLHLPGTIANLTIINQTQLTEFVCPDYSNITTLRLERVSGTIDARTILTHMENGSRVRIIDFTWSFQTAQDMLDYFETLDRFAGIDQNGTNTEHAQLYGTVYVPTLTGAQAAEITSKYPDVRITYDTITSQLKYYNLEGDTLLYTETISNGGNGSWNGTPSHSPTAQYTYVFAGWSLDPNATIVNPNAVNSVISDRNVYAVYTTTTRTYTVTFKNSDGTVLQTVQNVPYGGTATFTGTDPTHPTDPTNYRFNGFLPTGANITGDTNCIAQYMDVNSPFIKYLKRNLTAYESNTATKIGQYAFYGMTTLTSVRTSATVIEQYAFSGCSSLTSVELTSASGAVSIATRVFENCTKITEVIIRSSQVATLANANVFPAAIFNALNGAIYVPDNLVASYKAASGWSTYASRIYGLSSYPVTDFSSISDSWLQIAAAAADGIHSTRYNKGDTKQLTYGNYTLMMQYAYDRPEGPVWIVKNFAETKRFHSSMIEYGSSEIDTYLNTTVFGQLPAELQSAIAEVPITYWDGVASEEKTINRKVWLLSSKEVGFTGTSCKETNGYVFSDLFTSTNSTRVKYNMDTDSAGYWWLRSSNGASNIAGVQSSGSFNSGSAANKGGVVFGFVLYGPSD